MSVHVRFRLQDGRTCVLIPQDIIGRSRRAACVLHHPRVSGSHAQVELRGGRLHLLALRGRLWLDGDVTADVVLVPGQVIGLYRNDVQLVVEHVEHGDDDDDEDELEPR